MPLHLTISIALLVCVWGFVFFRKTGLIGGCLATLFAGSCLGHSLVHVSLVTSDRLLLGGVLVAYMMARNLFGLRARKPEVTDWLVLLFVGYLSLHTFLGDWRWQSGRPVSLLLFFYLMPFGIYWVASRCPLSEQSQGWVLWFFAVFSVYLSITSICEVLGLHALVFPKYIVNSQMVEFLGRGRGPFLNPAGNGIYMSAGLVACLMLWKSVKQVHRPLLVGAALLICCGAFCTLTRSVWLGFALALFVASLLIVPKQHRLRVLLVGSLGGALALGMLGSKVMSFKRDKHLTAKETADSAKLRPILAAFAYEMFNERPLTGVGLSQYKRYNTDYITNRSFDLPLGKATPYVQHNVVLSLLVETGLIGALAFCLVFIVWIRNGVRLWFSTTAPSWQRQIGLLCVFVLTAYFPSAMFQDTAVIPMLNMLIFFLAGLNRNVLDRANAMVGDLSRPVRRARANGVTRALPV